ncbi:MAG: lipoyl(octanoyl) transferase LipB [Dehalococcoidia bacterium]|nr:lipoyl(octanoyl) transferase LipB [Dehalococcoidia bacterium]
MSKDWLLLRPGFMDYDEAWDLQGGLLAARHAGVIDDALVLLQHNHVYTMGRRATESHLLISEAEMKARGIALYYVDRGGDVTYHGPGQITGYPIIDLRKRGLDVHSYIRALERALIQVLADFGITGRQDAGYTGVWAEDEKIAAIGVRISRGITMHGFALNVDPCLSYFDGIIPCGIKDRGVTSIAKLLGSPVKLVEVEESILRAFQSQFGGSFREVSLSDLALVETPV